MQVNIPVLIPGQPPMSVALLGLQRSDTRLLHVAAKLGPLISAAAQEAATQQVGMACTDLSAYPLGTPSGQVLVCRLGAVRAHVAE